MAFKFGGDVTAVVQSVLFAHGFNQVSRRDHLMWNHNVKISISLIK